MKREVHFQFSILHFPLLALALTLFSCSGKQADTNAPAKGFSVEVTLPDDGLPSRSVPAAPAGHALRCVLEAWTRDGNTLKARVEKVADGTGAIALQFDLEDAGDYTAVLWADYIDEGATPADATLDGVAFRHYPDKYYRTDAPAKGLRLTSVMTPYANTYDTPDTRDAFTGTLEFTKGSAAATDLKVTLARPLSRVTLAEKNPANADLCASVTATCKVPAAIDAFTGELVAGEQADATLSGTPGSTAVNVNGAACRVLFTHLVLAPADGTMGEINLSFTPTPDADKVLPDVTIPAGVPLKRGYRVNAAGSLLAPTDPPGRVAVSVDIDEAWTGDNDAENFLRVPDANFRQFCVDNGYADADGYIIPAKAATVTVIDVSGKNNIASLEGIQYFTALEKLYCYDNTLTSLDVSGCKALETLECGSNRLTSLDVKECIALKSLYCYDNTLTSLDVSGCKALEELNCRDNTSLDSLDVSGCKALRTLFCYNTSLASLDVSGCKALEVLSCHNTSLVSLDVSGCKALKRLDCNNTSSLATLDVTGCKALERLDCSNSSLATLDLSGCEALSELYCHNNRLTTLDVSNTLKNYSGYKLRCGNQKDANGNPVTLYLTLAEGQKAHWNDLSTNPYNNLVTLQP